MWKNRPEKVANGVTCEENTTAAVATSKPSLTPASPKSKPAVEKKVEIGKFQWY